MNERAEGRRPVERLAQVTTVLPSAAHCGGGGALMHMRACDGAQPNDSN